MLLFSARLHYATSLDVSVEQQFGKYVENFSFSPNSRYLAMLLWDNTLQVYKVKKNQIELKEEVKGVKDYVFSKNSNYLASIFWSGHLEVLDLRNMQTILNLASVKMFKFSPNSKSICVLFNQDNVRYKASKNVQIMKVYDIPNKY